MNCWTCLTILKFITLNTTRNEKYVKFVAFEQINIFIYIISMAICKESMLQVLSY